MPIALYPELAQSLTNLVKRLTLWARLAPMEEQILRRARGAFLVRWFGPLVPEHRLNLFIAIENIDALRARLARAEDSRRQGTAMNLLQPLATYAGTLMGFVLSPTGGALFGFLATELVYNLGTGWLEWIPKAIVALLTGPQFPAASFLVLGLGVPSAFLWLLTAVMNGNKDLREVHDLLGDAAMMLDAFFRFWDQLTGPVGAIRNPVLRAIVTFANRFAHLFAQVLGFLAVIIEKVLPLVPSLIDQWRAIKALGVETLAVVSEATDGIVEALLAPFGKRGIMAALLTIFHTLLDLPDQVFTSINDLVSGSRTEITLAMTEIGKRLTSYFDGFKLRLKTAFAETPLAMVVERIKALLAMKPAIMSAFANIGKDRADVPAPSGPGKLAQTEDSLRSLTTGLVMAGIDKAAEALPGTRKGKAVGPQTASAVADLLGALQRVSLPTLPSLSLPALPGLPDLPDTTALQVSLYVPGTEALGQDPADLFRKAQEADKKRKLPAEMYRRPQSVFGDLLKANAAPTAPDAAQMAMRDAIFGAVGRILPSGLAVFAPKLRGYFDKIDSFVYDRVARDGPDPVLPDLDLPDSGLLRPVVEVLEVHAPDGTQRPDLRSFANFLADAMRSESYRVRGALLAAGG